MHPACSNQAHGAAFTETGNSEEKRVCKEDAKFSLGDARFEVPLEHLSQRFLPGNWKGISGARERGLDMASTAQGAFRAKTVVEITQERCVEGLGMDPQGTFGDF